LGGLEGEVHVLDLLELQVLRVEAALYRLQQVAAVLPLASAAVLLMVEDVGEGESEEVEDCVGMGLAEAAHVVG